MLTLQHVTIQFLNLIGIRKWLAKKENGKKSCARINVVKVGGDQF